MFRRKLFIYTCMYAAGITAGFFVLERSRTAEAAGLIISLATAVIMPDTGFQEKSLTKHEHNRQKGILIILVILGLLMFCSRAVVYDSSALLVSSMDSITGTVKSAELKDDKAKLVIKTSDPRLCCIQILCEADCIDIDGTELRESDLYDLLGSVISARGEYKEINSADNPGNFDYRLYMRGKGIPAAFRAYSLDTIKISNSAPVRLKRHLYRTRELFINRFDEETQGFIRGVIFGDKSEIDEEVIREFNNNSTGHILAVSGLHMGFLYGLLRALTGRKKSLPVSVLIIAVILLYGEMTLWSPATVRACVVLTISLLSVHLRRRSDLLTSVSLAAFIILIFEPYQLFNAGFQMSFLALLGISFFTKPLSSVTGEALGVMLAVQAGTFPVIVYTFGRFDPLAIFINVPVILLSSVLVPLCILLLMMETAIGTSLQPGINLAELISYAVIKINHLLNFNGEFSFTAAGYGCLVLIVLYVLAFALASEWMKIQILRKDHKTILRAAFILLMPVLMLSSCLFDRFSDDEIVFAAVGQGDCTHIRAGDHDVLIDGGGVSDFEKRNTTGSSKFNVGEKILMPYLLREGARDVDLALVTHLHSDHYKGIAELAEIYPVDAIGIPIDYRGSESITTETDDRSGNPESQFNINGSNTRILYIKPDTKIHIRNDVSIEVLWPLVISKDPVAADDPNEHNTVYMITYKGKKIMVTGDLLEEDELEMVRHYEGTDKLKCDILKVAHHGSRSSSSEEFLDAASPGIAVIQCGRNNIYGHPHQETIDKLESRGIRVYRTDMNGAVGIDIRGSKLLIDLFKKNIR